MLFKRLRPAVSELLEKGTDYSFHGRFVDTLSYNHFTTEDFAKLKQIDELIARTSKKYLPKSFSCSMN